MIDTAALREKVLDLAIRGKLVPQDPTDEPASVLLERIHEQKLQMVREGKLKAKDVKDDTIIFKGDNNCYYEKFSDGTIKSIQDEIPFELPDTWSWVRLGVIFSHNTGKALKTSNTIGKKLTYITTSNLYWNSFVVESLKEMYFNESEIDKYSAHKGDLLVCEGGDIGRAAIWTFDYDMRIQNHIHKLRTYYPIETKLYYYTFYYYKLIGKINGNGIGIQGLSSNALHNLIVPLPPIQEQTRITAAVNKCFLTADIIDENEKILQTDIEELKFKILELAIQGKLVPQDENDEPASVLLERIRAERKAKLGKKYVESYIFKGDDNCYYEKVGSTVKNITDQIPFSIPQNWSFVRLKELAKVVSGVSYDKRDICNDGIRIIRGGNISNLSIVLLPDDVFLPQKYYDNEKEVKTEDIVIVASTGSKIAIGRPAFADKSFPQTQIGAFLRIVRPYVPNVYQYLKCLFASNYYREHISDLVHGNTINNIKTEYLDEFIIPFPPIREQKEIANKVKILMDILKGGD